MKQDWNRDAAEQYSLRGRVFKKLRDDILSGRCGENEELKEASIGDELGVSRTPVREALRQLELEGLVCIVPNKGAYVTGITPKDVMDIYRIRALLEGLCANWATKHITEKQMEELEENLYMSQFHALKGNFDQLTELDNQFHEILYEACGSKMLRHVLRDFHQYVGYVRRQSYHSADRGTLSNEEHRRITEAIRKKDADLAGELANRHMVNALDHMLALGLDAADGGSGLAADDGADGLAADAVGSEKK